MRAVNKICVLILFLGLLCCKRKPQPEKVATLFQLMPKEITGIDFKNALQYDEKFNVYTYRNYYNGGGVSIGDINNDGLSDIYFTSNLGPNKLFLNKGDFKFEDISETAGIEGSRAWSTGTNMVDINADGWLDIYVCNSGDIDGDDKQNELFINNHDNTFTERAADFGLADQGLSTQAAFFDYDRDGDLDAYILNNSFRAIGSFNLKDNERSMRDTVNGDRFYKNTNGHFEDISASAGIYGSTIGFGLGIAVSDLNNDGWQDLYICNDFFERDYVYMNMQDGTFEEKLTDQMRSISMASMGVDAADLNNDGYPEIFVTEMLPKDEARLKTSMSFENWNKYQYNVKNDYHEQFTRNMLQVNNGPIQQNISFSEQSRMSGTEATDWSWGAVLADFDLNGTKDLYITNGVYQDILNQDYLNYISNDIVARSMVTENGVNFKKLIDIIPSQPIANVAYSGDEKMIFNDSTLTWGLDKPGFSNGVAYGDLDNDGDLDLVVNNVNMEAFIYKNQAANNKPDSHYLKINLKGTGQNTYAIGAKITTFQKGKTQINALMPTRGFQSSVDYAIVFGFEKGSSLDSLWVDWPTGKRTLLKDVALDQHLIIDTKNAMLHHNTDHIQKQYDFNFRFKEVSEKLSDAFEHNENRFSDFDKDGMLFQMNSTEGPKIAVADVNGDNLDDAYLCGAAGSPGKLFVQNTDGTFSWNKSQTFEKDSRSEDTDALFFDADGDGDRDLYVSSGGNEYPSSSSALSDRLYFNDGYGNFKRAQQLLPTTQFESTSCVKAADFDDDGDLDLFVGVRLKDRRYGEPQNGYLLKNDGNGHFEDVTETLAPELLKLGLIKDAIWADYDNDKNQDLIVVGEWMPISVFRNTQTGFVEVTEEIGLSQYSGWWNTIETADLDNDGDLDFILGNHGLNSRFRASRNKPITCYVNDFDQNGSTEQIICTYNGEDSYPLALRHDITAQLPYLKKRFLKYEDYKLKKVTDIFSEQQLRESTYHKATYLESAVLWNQGDATFSLTALPREAQVSPVYAIYTSDFNEDGFVDILLAGNLFEVKPEIGKYDANYGSCLLGNGKGGFVAVPNQAIGLVIEGQIRDISPITVRKRELLLVAANNNKVQGLQIEKTPNINPEK